MPNVQLANNLRYLRKKHNLTQDDVSRVLNISRQAYSNYETSNRTPDLDTLICLSSYYQISLDDLAFRSLPGMTASSDTLRETPVSYTLTSDKNTGNSIYLTEEELNLILRFRTLSRENKQIITGFLRSNSNFPAD
ncbi:helix-turn-helix transcriptional regulator [Faecalicatena contorta]|uniref:helix-turn-helix transcriptional regulator n=1 Tax=Faecalicatena contorta TaxID=39482 RepID=UPI001F3083E1|nr:helix-turn-helix transcriptional regulator [Faecalicatena contorta]MCF2681948.1 helix-turn-helix transcriptional regulator [Faecalicatena contorta]